MRNQVNLHMQLTSVSELILLFHWLLLEEITGQISEIQYLLGRRWRNSELPQPSCR